jgi:hypothetical protein
MDPKKGKDPGIDFIFATGRGRVSPPNFQEGVSLFGEQRLLPYRAGKPQTTPKPLGLSPRFGNPYYKTS